MSTFVSFGTLQTPFKRMAEAVIDNYEILPAPIFIQAGCNQDFFSSRGIDSSYIISLSEYDCHLESCGVFISHGGVGSLKKSNSNGLFPCLFTREERFGEHLDDHQKEFLEFHSRLNLFFPAFGGADLKKFIEQKIYLNQPNSMDWNESGLLDFLSGFLQSQFPEK